MHGGASLAPVGVVEVDVGSDGAVVQGLHGTEVVGHLRLREGLVALHQLSEGVELLHGDVDWLIHDEPCGRFPTPGVSCGAVVGHVVVGVGQEAGQGQVLDGPLHAPVSDFAEA